MALVIIILSFFAGIVLKMPNLYPIVVGLTFIIMIVVLVFQRKIFLGVVIFFLGLFVVTGGMSLQTKMTGHFQIKEVQASAGGVFIVDSQNIDYPIPYSPEPEAQVAAAEGEPQPQQPIADANSSNCEFYDRYPAKVQPWCALIEAAANKPEHEVDALLIASVMLQESGGQPEIMSSSGAVGLMQVMPSDGISAGFQCINGPCFAGRPTIEQLKDPTTNVFYAANMLHGLIERYGDIREALKSYGPFDVGYRYADQVLTIRNSL